MQPNGSRLSCAALVKESSFNILHPTRAVSFKRLLDSSPLSLRSSAGSCEPSEDKDATKRDSDEGNNKSRRRVRFLGVSHCETTEEARNKSQERPNAYQGVGRELTDSHRRSSLLSNESRLSCGR